jgi:energy-coupling factor transporter ATP-binding protein EcfA2
MNQDLLQQFQAAYRDLDLFPLIQPDMIEKLRVEYGREVLLRLKQEVDGGAKDGKVVFTGHRGCGKSTLLKQFSNEMRSKYFTVFFSVADSIELSAVTHTNILYATGIMLLSKATKANIPVDATTKQVLLEWTNQDKKTSEKTIKNGAELEVDLQVITLKLQREGTFRDEIEKTFERRITDLVLCLDRLAVTIQNTTKKPVLVIIDDLDKLGLKAAENIYVDNLKSLFSPAFKMLLTVPIEAARNTDIVASLMSEGIVRIRLFPVLKFYSRNDVRRVEAEPIAKNMAILKKWSNGGFRLGQ